MSKTKVCTSCKAEKDIKEFCKNRYSKDGLFTWCRKCLSERRSPPLKVRIKCDNCGKPIVRYKSDVRKYKRSLCRDCHYDIFKENNPNWKGGKTKHVRGYVAVLCPEHPRAHKNSGYVFEHILVAEQKIGRPLRDDEEVHHIDGDKSNNDPDNLQVLTVAEHRLLHSYGYIEKDGWFPGTIRENKQRLILTIPRALVNKGLDLSKDVEMKFDSGVLYVRNRT